MEKIGYETCAYMGLYLREPEKFDQVVEISAATGEGVDELRPLIRDKKSLLSGNSGVGKSTPHQPAHSGCRTAHRRNQRGA